MPIRRIISPIRELSERGQLAGVLLLVATAASLLLSNSGFGPGYLAFWNEHVGFGPLDKSFAHWINDGLMAVFFFMVGLEIRREVLHGELAEPRQAMLPALAAVGGVLAPALIHFGLTHGTPAASGWAIPTATDIAFSLGILALLGDRVPFALRVFLTALAIIDDLLAVLIIAAFYSGGLHLPYLLGAAGIFALLLGLNRLRVRPLWIYLVLGAGLWFCVLESGIHATIAGVLLALTVPADRIEDLEGALQRPVNYVVLPLFALCNTAIALSADVLPQLTSGLALGVGLGLLLGKPLGIVGVTWLLVRLGLGQLPTGVNWRRFIGLGFTAGIGFTMAIFIATLSYQDAAAVDLAKLAVLLGSAASGIVGALILAPGQLTETGEAQAQARPVETYLQRAWSDALDNVSMADVRTAITQVQRMDDEHGAFWVGVIIEEKNTLEVDKNLTVVAMFDDNPDDELRRKARSWQEVEQLYELFLQARFQEVRQYFDMK